MVLEIYPTVVMWHNFIGLFRGRYRTERPFFVGFPKVTLIFLIVYWSKYGVLILISKS